MNTNNYSEFLVGKDKVLHTNLLSSGIFSKDKFDLAIKEISKHKYSIYGSVEDLKLDYLGCITITLDKSFSLTLNSLILHGCSEILDYYTNLHNIINPEYLITNWVYYQHSSCSRFFWHDHQKLAKEVTEPYTGNIKSVVYPSTLTYVIYLQAPDTENCNGKLWFTTDRSKKGEVLEIGEEDISFSPSAGDMLIFPGNVLHCPEPHTDSTARFVLAGNMYIKNSKVAI